MHETLKHGAIAVALRRRLDVDILSRQLSATLHCQVSMATSEINSAATFIRNRGARAYILDANFPQDSLKQAAQAALECSPQQPLLLLDDSYSSRHAQFAESISAAYCSRDVSIHELMEIIE